MNIGIKVLWANNPLQINEKTTSKSNIGINIPLGVMIGNFGNNGGGSYNFDVSPLSIPSLYSETVGQARMRLLSINESDSTLSNDVVGEISANSDQSGFRGGYFNYQSGNPPIIGFEDSPQSPLFFCNGIPPDTNPMDNMYADYYKELLFIGDFSGDGKITIAIMTFAEGFKVILAQDLDTTNLKFKFQIIDKTLTILDAATNIAIGNSYTFAQDFPENLYVIPASFSQFGKITFDLTGTLGSSKSTVPEFPNGTEDGAIFQVTEGGKLFNIDLYANDFIQLYDNLSKFILTRKPQEIQQLNSTDDLPEGQSNLYYTTNVSEDIRNKFDAINNQIVYLAKKQYVDDSVQWQKNYTDQQIESVNSSISYLRQDLSLLQNNTPRLNESGKISDAYLPLQSINIPFLAFTLQAVESAPNLIPVKGHATRQATYADIEWNYDGALKMAFPNVTAPDNSFSSFLPNLKDLSSEVNTYKSIISLSTDVAIQNYPFIAELAIEVYMHQAAIRLALRTSDSYPYTTSYWIEHSQYDSNGWDNEVVATYPLDMLLEEFKVLIINGDIYKVSKQGTPLVKLASIYQVYPNRSLELKIIKRKSNIIGIKSIDFNVFKSLS